jgi:hypothetical protein
MAATTVANPARPMEATNGHHHAVLKSSTSEHLRQLTLPPPTSMVLIASLQLLTAPLVPPHHVYLMTQQYLQNWINWAFHQPVASPGEKQRLAEVLRLAAVRHRLACPTHNTQYSNPGPINSNELSMQGHPLLLRPDAAVLVQSAADATSQQQEDEAVPSSLRRARSLPNSRGYLEALAGSDGESSLEFKSCAVPELFYEVSAFTCWKIFDSLSLKLISRYLDTSGCTRRYLRRWIYSVISAVRNWIGKLNASSPKWISRQSAKRPPSHSSPCGV